MRVLLGVEIGVIYETHISVVFPSVLTLGSGNLHHRSPVLVRLHGLYVPVCRTSGCKGDNKWGTNAIPGFNYLTAGGDK